MRTIRRRRLQRKTDYKARLALLKSNSPRLIIRKTNSYIITQIVETKQAQDKIIIGITSKILLSKGWPKNLTGSLKSIPAAYCTGFLLGKELKKHKIEKVILDIGMHRNIHRSRIFAAVKGFIDSGQFLKHNPEALPKEEDLNKNEKLNELLKKITNS
jgi:large subunit ribosomal protein L18